MNVFILYRPNSEHDTAVNSYAREFERRTGQKLELMSLDTVEGAHKAELYDVTSYPAILAVRDNGELVQLWQDEMLPMVNEVSGYLSQ